MVKDSGRRRYPLPDRSVLYSHGVAHRTTLISCFRYIEVIDERQTGETLLDEALKMIKTSEKMGVGNWVDLMSGRYPMVYSSL